MLCYVLPGTTKKHWKQAAYTQCDNKKRANGIKQTVGVVFDALLCRCVQTDAERLVN